MQWLAALYVLGLVRGNSELVEKLIAAIALASAIVVVAIAGIAVISDRAGRAAKDEVQKCSF
jgi:hypothetical protein